VSDDYFLTMPGSSLSPELLDAMRDWLKDSLPVPSIEVVEDVWLLFADEETRAVVEQRLREHPSSRPAAYAAIRLVAEAAVLSTVRDPVTDRALRTFAEWAMQQVPLRLNDAGLDITIDDLVDPELYD
jgi:hypothetical protein